MQNKILILSLLFLFAIPATTAANNTTTNTTVNATNVIVDELDVTDNSTIDVEDGAFEFTNVSLFDNNTFSEEYHAAIENEAQATADLENALDDVERLEEDKKVLEEELDDTENDVTDLREQLNDAEQQANQYKVKLEQQQDRNWRSFWWLILVGLILAEGDRRITRWHFDTGDEQTIGGGATPR